MAVLDTYAPFDTGAGGEVWEETWRKMSRHWLASGVLAGEANELECYGDSSGRQVKVKTGQVWVYGHWGESTSEKTIPISANGSGNPRIDRIVIRADFVANTVSIEVIEGTPAGSPVAPSLTQSATRWEISLAQVAVANGASTIAAGDVTDERQFSGAYASQWYDAGNSGTSKTIDLVNGPRQKLTLTDNCTLSFSHLVEGAEMLLKLVQDATGSRAVTWPAGTKFKGGASGSALTSTANAIDNVVVWKDVDGTVNVAISKAYST